MNDSPDKLLVEAEKSITSAPRRRAAKEKLVGVFKEQVHNRAAKEHLFFSTSLRGILAHNCIKNQADFLS